MASMQMRSMQCRVSIAGQRAVRALPVRSRPSVQCRAAATDTDAPVDELANLAGATVAELGALSGLFFAFDKLIASQVIPAAVEPKYLVFAILLVLSTKSGKLSVLDTRRPYARKGEVGFKDRKRPGWCPPGPVFGIVWTSIAFLRATAGMVVYEEVGALASLPLLLFATHLAIGDTWNYVTNTQARLGSSALGATTLVLPSAVAVVATYYTVSPQAGLTLLPLPLWLTVAQALAWSIWGLNGRQPLLPRKASD